MKLNFTSTADLVGDTTYALYISYGRYDHEQSWNQWWARGPKDSFSNRPVAQPWYIPEAPVIKVISLASNLFLSLFTASAAIYTYF